MRLTRYAEARTFIRGLRRCAGETREQFKAKLLRLRRQFEQFNVDVSELCQWLMSLRPNGKKGSDETKVFWEFFLEPEGFLDEAERDNSDTYRRMGLDVAMGLLREEVIRGIALNQTVVESVHEAAALTRTQTATRLFERLDALGPSQRQVLAKAAAEWIVGRYLRAYDNWQRQHEEWEKEKRDWESKHPELAEPVRDGFNEIFKGLDIRFKKPRVCLWERLKEGKDDCQWAGERIRIGGNWQSHAALCVKYKKFFDTCGGDSRNKAEFKKYFVENAKAYLKLRRSSRGGKKVAMQRFMREHPQARWFPQAWEAYLNALEINEETVLAAGCELPHCVVFGADKKCEHNKHTEKCEEYRKILANRPGLQQIEGLYRDWRGEYLTGPQRAAFRYPSGSELSAPKIFGEGFWHADFENSVLDVSLGGQPGEEVERFGFKAWPKDYEPQPDEANITSVQISFVGTRARVGFHFEVGHRRSRFGVSQDAIDDLRSRKYPRRIQDQKFVDDARKLLLESFDGDVNREMRVLAVDLGTEACGVGLFEGRELKKCELLKVVKIDRLYDAPPKRDKRCEDKTARAEKEQQAKKGLGKGHIGLHLNSWAEGSKEIAEKRGAAGTGIGEHDMRRLSLHVGWMIRDWVRLNASQIIEMAERNKVDLIVFESLRGFKAPGYDNLDEDKKRRLAFFAHGRIRRKVAEKAVERGMRIVTVPYFKSSQFCAVCGREQQDKNKWGSNKRKHKFRCEGCGREVNSDENAAGVLGKVFWGEIRLPEKLSQGT